VPKMRRSMPARSFDWRRRTFYGTVVDGQAAIPVERLTYGDLTYEVWLVPVIVNGTRFTTAPEPVVVRGGQESPASVTLHARPERGSITGTVVDGASGEGLEAALLVVDLASGAAQTTTAAADVHFMFDDLPVAEHALLARRADGFHLPQRHDLAEASTVETRLRLTRAGTAVLRGVVTFEGEPLPFAQAEVEGLPAAQADPMTGAFALDAVAGEGELSVEVAAAGCYGVRLNTTARDLGEITLALHEDTTVIERGGSRLYVPAQSSITRDGDRMVLQGGVLWVTGAAPSAVTPRR